MKKIISAILSFALLVTLLIPFGTMTVSADEPTLITDQAGLANLSATGNYKLGNDITITGEWSNDVMFYGTLDGDGHTVTFADGSTVNGGLFKQIREGAVVKDLNIVANNVTWKTGGSLQGIGTQCMGGLTASIEAGDGKYNDITVITSMANIVTIQNVHVTADFTTIDADVNYLAIGGIVGDLGLICLIENCSYTGTITDINRDAVDMNAYTSGCGGIVGVAVRNCGPIAISKCVNNGNISGYGQVGGILGYCRGWGGGETAPSSLLIQECVNNGSITCEQTEVGTELNPKRATSGGIAGFVYAKNGATVEFRHNINYGEVIAKAADGANISAGICGVIRQKETVTFAGNINYGAAVAQIMHTGTSSGVVNYVNNYASSGGVSTLYTTFENAGGVLAVFNVLNEAYPGVYAFEEGEDDADDIITLAGASSDSGPSTLDVPQTMTMNVTVPEPTGTAITNQKELESMKTDGTYYLANDIEIKGTLKSIAEFSGVFHGNGHAIVLNGAELRGGLFKSLAGGSIYNLSITEMSGASSENSYRGLIAHNEIDLCFGTVAGYGYGTIVNVTTNCAVGSALKNTSNSYVGGVIGMITDGATILYNCYNTGRVQGGFVGGIVGNICCESGIVEIVKCVNWGECISSTGLSGGIFATHSLSSTQVDMSLLVLENINYGAVSSTESQYSGGIGGSMQSFWSGKASVLRNVNYGTVTANVADKGCPGGIMGYLGYKGMMISGNVNLGTVTGSKSPNRLAGMAESNDSNVIENNFAAQAEIPATIGTVVGAELDGNTVATLNGVYSDAFVAGEPIALKWAADAGLSTTAPKVTYTIAADPGQSENPEEEGNNTDTETSADTSEVGTDASVPQTKKGCGSAIGIGGVVALLMLGGAGAMVVARRKED